MTYQIHQMMPHLPLLTTWNPLCIMLSEIAFRTLKNKELKSESQSVIDKGNGEGARKEGQQQAEE